MTEKLQFSSLFFYALMDSATLLLYLFR